ncbi:MAG TPA: 4-hydroxy-tetrahydrodipicolinate reductase [Candidatus Eisenbacteria bacterium]|nr:4-hydroxy-tetrahydrodipicolinate reductase [Candidatus Eisenbacteria bacterium]
MAEVPLLLYGATGRMGRAVRECIPEFPELRLRTCVAPRKPNTAAAGTSWLTPDELSKDGTRASLPDDLVILDFSLAAGTARLSEILSEWPRALVAATTGLDAATESRLTALAARAPVLRAPNLSLGIAVAESLLRALPPAARGAFQTEIVEHHHAGKKDAPSGTAKALAALMRSKGGGPGSASGDEIPIHSIRGGTVPGTHRVILSGAGETLEMVHTVYDRSVFARGALRAARFLHRRAPGNYTIDDVLRES